METFRTADNTPVRAVLAGVYETGSDSSQSNAGTNENYISESDFLHSMEELKELASACLMKPVGMLTQQLEHRNTAYYLGQGKLKELKNLIAAQDAGTVILNDTLTPSQLRNIQSELNIRVMDRTALILEIFRSRARTRESKLQVELARLQYIKPRLIGMWEKQNRQGGASGSMSSKGEGETQLEIDRRTIDHRITELRRELKNVERERSTQRSRRRSSRLPYVALVGYTNAGKSTVMNSLVNKFCGDEEKKVFEADMLFATLDTTVRRIDTGNSRDFLLSDTVGFIQKLPTALIEAFHSTLEEVKEADLLLQVVDRSDERYNDHIKATMKTIGELGAGHIPMITVYNKCDLCEESVPYPRKVRDDSIFISAKEDPSLDLLVDAVSEKIFSNFVSAQFLIPYDKGSICSALLENSQLISQEYRADGTFLAVRCHMADAGRYAAYLLNKEILPPKEEEF